MDISTAVTIAIALCLVVFVPWFIVNVRYGKARGHSWFTWWKPRGHSDIGPDLGSRDTGPDADAARGARY